MGAITPPASGSSNVSSPLSSPPATPRSVLASPTASANEPASPGPAGRYPSPSSSLSSLSFLDSSSEWPPVSPSSSSPDARDDIIESSQKSALSRLPLPSYNRPSAAKRRRGAAGPTERTTQHLNLATAIEGGRLEDNELVQRLIHALRHGKKIVVVAGAGISVSAGVPDFRSARGLFKSAGKDLFDASVYRHDDSTESFHNMVRELGRLTRQAKPTEFHHMLASLACEDRLLRLYSQNVDCIDTSLEPLRTRIPLNAKGPWPKTIQLHGGLDKMVCAKCGGLEDFEPSLFEGPEAPPCQRCEDTELARTAGDLRGRGVGRMRPRMVLYNEFNPDADAIGSVSEADLRKGPDAVFVVGTSLKIPGVRRLVKELCLCTRSRRGGFTAWINVDAEPQGIEFKDCFDMVVQGSSEDVAALAGLERWDSSARDSQHHILTRKETGQLRLTADERDRLEVRLLSPRKPKAKKNAGCKIEPIRIGIPTPGASPKLGPKMSSSKDKGKTKDNKTKDNKTKAKKLKDKTKQTKLLFDFGPASVSVTSEGSAVEVPTLQQPTHAGINATSAPAKSKRTALPTHGRRIGTARAKAASTIMTPPVPVAGSVLNTFKASKKPQPGPSASAAKVILKKHAATTKTTTTTTTQGKRKADDVDDGLERQVDVGAEQQKRRRLPAKTTAGPTPTPTPLLALRPGRVEAD